MDKAPILKIWMLLLLALMLLHFYSDNQGAVRQPEATITVCARGCDYTHLQAAIDAAAAGNTIRVAAGVYTGTVIIARPVTLQGMNKVQMAETSDKKAVENMVVAQGQ